MPQDSAHARDATKRLRWWQFRLWHVLVALTGAAIAVRWIIPPQTVIISPRIMNAGVVAPGQAIVGTFHVHNAGTEPLEVLVRPISRKSSKTEHRVVPPGERVAIRLEGRIRPETGDPFPFRMRYTVFTNRRGEEEFEVEMRADVR